MMSKIYKIQDTRNKGFTLIELLTAVSIFAVIMTISLGSIIGIFDANRKTRSLRTAVSNLNLAMESMAKEMRFATNYHCGFNPPYANPQNCPSGDDYIHFLSNDGIETSYYLSGTTINKAVSGGIIIPLTPPELIIDNLTFYTVGAGTNNTLQPKVLIIVKAHAGGGKSRSDFVLQTLVSQRDIDI